METTKEQDKTTEQDTSGESLMVKVKERLDADEAQQLEELANDYYDDETAALSSIKDDDDRLDTAIHELADGAVSVYTHDRLEWLTNNHQHCDQEEAIAMGAKSAEDIAAWCWYEQERNSLRELTGKVRDILEELEIDF